MVQSPFQQPLSQESLYSNNTSRQDMPRNTEVPALDSSLYQAPQPQPAPQFTASLATQELNPQLDPTSRGIEQVISATSLRTSSSRVVGTTSENDILSMIRSGTQTLREQSRLLGQMNIPTENIDNGVVRNAAGLANLIPDVLSFTGQVVGYVGEGTAVGVAALTANPEAIAKLQEWGKVVGQFILNNAQRIDWGQLALAAPGVVKDVVLSTAASLATGNLSELVNSWNAMSENGNLLNRAIFVWELVDTIQTVATYAAIGAAVVAGGPVAWGIVGGMLALEAAEIVMKRVAVGAMSQAGQEITERLMKELTQEAVERIGKESTEVLTETIMKQVRDAGINVSNLSELTAEQFDEVMEKVVTTSIPTADSYDEVIKRLRDSEQFAEVTEAQLQQALQDRSGSLWGKIRDSEFDRVVREQAREGQVKAIRDQLNKEIMENEALREAYGLNPEELAEKNITPLEAIMGNQVHDDLAALMDAKDGDIQRVIRERGWEGRVTEAQVKEWRSALINSSDAEFAQLKEEMISALSKEMTDPDNALRRRILDSANRQWDEVVDQATLLREGQRQSLKETGHRATAEAYDEVMESAVRRGIESRWDDLEQKRRRRLDRDGAGSSTDDLRPIRRSPLPPVRQGQFRPVEGDDPLVLTSSEDLSRRGVEKNTFWEDMQNLGDARLASERNREAISPVVGSSNRVDGELAAARLNQQEIEQGQQLARDFARVQFEQSLYGSAPGSHSRHLRQPEADARVTSPTVYAPTLQV